MIGITIGDPAGIGPEITLKALAAMAPAERAATRVFGCLRTLEAAQAVAGTALRLGQEVAVTDLPVADAPLPYGQPDPRAGDAAYRFVAAAVRAAEAGEIGCLVTAPVNKAALNAAGHRHDGHTGLLAALTGQSEAFMLLASERLSVIHVSTHLSLRKAIDRATPERILRTIRAGHAHLRRMGLAAPRIAVAGLNPHCGEGGLFGTEEVEQIAPAVAAARAEGITALGPAPADTIFHRAWNGHFDLVVAMYHDQGHIPIKLVAFDSAVNVTLGLPVARTSVDHGTAFDIAGQGVASPGSMIAAIAYARRLCTDRSGTAA